MLSRPSPWAPQSPFPGQTVSGRYNPFQNLPVLIRIHKRYQTNTHLKSLGVNMQQIFYFFSLLSLHLLSAFQALPFSPHPDDVGKACKAVQGQRQDQKEKVGRPGIMDIRRQDQSRRKGPWDGETSDGSVGLTACYCRSPHHHNTCGNRNNGRNHGTPARHLQ